MNEEAAHALWRSQLYERLRGRAYPLLIDGERVTPSAALWAGARLWTGAFRQAGLQPGDRVVLALPPSAPFVQVLIAAIWEGVTVALADPPKTNEAASLLLTELDARAQIALVPGPHTFTPDNYEGAWCEERL